MFKELGCLDAAAHRNKFQIPYICPVSKGCIPLSLNHDENSFQNLSSYVSQPSEVTCEEQSWVWAHTLQHVKYVSEFSPLP